MNPITSETFRKENIVLFSAPIVHYGGIGRIAAEPKDGYSPHGPNPNCCWGTDASLCSGDYIDLGRHGSVDCKLTNAGGRVSSDFLRWSEPRLAVPLKSFANIESVAGEVIRGAEMPSAERVSVEAYKRPQSEPFVLSPEVLAASCEIGRDDISAILKVIPDAATAIDLHTQEFLIYTPKK